MKPVLLSCLILLLTTFSRGQNTNLSGGVVFDGEPYMAIDPVNPQHIVVAWMGYVPLSHISIKVKATFNGGSSWSSPAVIPHQSGSYTSADVSLGFDHSGNLYCCFIDYRQSPDSGGVFITKSTDGGLSWGAAIHKVIDIHADGSKTPIDRPWLVIGKGAGAAPDTLYVTTKPTSWIAPPNRPYFMKSTDYGTTWSTWKYIDTTGYLVGSLIQAPMAAPAIDSAGIFHCVYPTYYPAESVYPRYIMASGGASGTFSYNVVYAAITGGYLDTLAKAGYRLICDPTQNLHYALFTLQNSTTDIDIQFFETRNGGITWNGPTRVNNDAAGNGKMQDLVWGNFDEHGNIVAAWRDRRNAAGSGYQQPSEIWGTIKWKDSTVFSPNFRISDTIVAYDSLYLSGNGNDFMNVVMAQDTLSAAWGDVRSGALNIWFSRRHVTSGTSSIQQIVTEPLPVVYIYPNPATNTITVSGENLEAVTLYDATGRRVLQQTIKNNEAILDISLLPHGVYTAHVRTGLGIVMGSVIK